MAGVVPQPFSAPPLIVQPEHVDEAVDKLDRVLNWVDGVELAG